MLQNVAFRLVRAALLVSEVFLVSYLTYRWLGTVCLISRLPGGSEKQAPKSMRAAKRFAVPPYSQPLQSITSVAVFRRRARSCARKPFFGGASSESQQPIDQVISIAATVCLDPRRTTVLKNKRMIKWIKLFMTENKNRKTTCSTLKMNLVLFLAANPGGVVRWQPIS